MNTLIPRLLSADAERNGFFLFLVFITAWRLIYLAITPLDLVPDEAYYWHWGTRPALGYYSKPPLIAWLNTISSFLFGNSPFSVRLPAVLFSSLVTCFLFALASRMYDTKTGFLAVLLAALSPAACTISFIMTIDSPLVLFWAASLYFLYRAMESKDNEDKQFFWWFMLTLSCGFGILSKQMMLLFPVLTLIFFVTHRGTRVWLIKPHVYLMMIFSFSFLLPTLYWNWRHDWITVSHTAHHFEGNPSFWSWLKTSLDFIGGQFLMLSPVFFVFFVWIAGSLLLVIKRIDDRQRLLIVFSLVPLTGFLLMSLRQRINANWPAVFYLPGFILVAAWLNNHIVCAKGLRQWAGARKWAVISGAALTILLYCLTFVFSLPALSGAPFDPLKRLKGWKELGAEVKTVFKETEEPGRTFLLAPTRQLVSELAFYGPVSDNIYQWNGAVGVIGSQYDLWPSPAKKTGWNCLFVAPDQYCPPPNLVKSFASFSLVGSVILGNGGEYRQTHNVYLGKSLKNWPR